ncbi:MAG: LLM class flavin-dependent oxidoreductase [Myxococcota bacterium]
MTPDRHLRFGIFLAPFHPVREDPTRALDRDLALVRLLDALGYDEAWIGEHHSAGYEIIGSPELFIAAAAGQTQQIRLGTGVVSLPYHHPLMVADRIVQLDHMTRGRVMFGAGPGALPSDAHMLGLDATRQREMMDESLGVILRLFRGETVSLETDWFTLRDARLQLLPFSKPYPEVACASQVSPSGARIAAKYGVGLLAIGATTQGGFNALYENWKIYEQKCAEHGREPDRSAWRLVGPMHVAETRDRARENVKFGLGDWLHYFQEIAALPLAPASGSLDEAIDMLVDQGFAVIGTPDDAAAQVERLIERSNGGFGAFLQLAHNWANWEDTQKSYQLFARYVMPDFQSRNVGRQASIEWAMKNRAQMMGNYGAAVQKEIQKHAAEQQPS